MTVRVTSRTIVRLAVAGAALLAIGCAESPTAPSITRSIQSTTTAAHDDNENPPDAPCDSGWVMAEGRWVCDPI